MKFSKSLWFWPLLLFIVIWIGMTIWPLVSIVLFATRIGFFTGYLVIASIIGLAIDAYYRRVPRVFLPVSIAVLSIGISIYYYKYFEEQIQISKIENELQAKNTKSIAEARNYIQKNSLTIVPLQSQSRQYSKYRVNYYYSVIRDLSDNSVHYTENFYLKQKYCNGISDKDQYIEFRGTAIKDESAEGAHMCYLRSRIKNPESMISYSQQQKVRNGKRNGLSISLLRKDVLINNDAIVDYLDASVNSLPIIPWPLVICGNLGGIVSMPDHVCSISFKSIISRELETRPNFAIKAGVSDVVAMILDMKPRKFLHFPDHEMSSIAKKALVPHLTLEAKSELF
ncbi:MAG: hypothetical protein ROO70_17885 [Labrenzia sp.]